MAYVSIICYSNIFSNSPSEKTGKKWGKTEKWLFFDRGYLYNIWSLFRVEMLIFPDFCFQKPENLEYLKTFSRAKNCSYIENILLKIVLMEMFLPKYS